MNEEIQNRLESLERERGIRILYACESGSRAWGFASSDSDYDVRGELISVSQLTEPVELAIVELVERKSAGGEKLVIDRDHRLHGFIDFQLAALEQVARQMLGYVPEGGLVDAFLQSVVADVA